MSGENSPIFFTNLDDLKADLIGQQEEEANVFSSLRNNTAPKQEWFTEDYEGQLSVDVYQTKNSIVVKATIAGVKSEDLEIYLHNDLLTIRGKREHQVENEEPDYFYKECYWGGFSRSVILPVEVQSDRVEATLKNGVLTVVMPKANKSRLINVQVTEE